LFFDKVAQRYAAEVSPANCWDNAAMKDKRSFKKTDQFEKLIRVNSCNPWLQQAAGCVKI